MDGRTAAAILGVAERADLDQIRAAFRARAKAAHPDLGGEPEAFAATLEAFRVLCLGRVDEAPTPEAFAALAATHGFVGYDSPRPSSRSRRSRGECRSFADELRVAMAREVASLHR